MEADGGVIEEKLFPRFAIVGDCENGAMDADEELVQSAVGVFSANVFAGNAVYEEVALDRERDVAGDFAKGDLATEILSTGEAMEGDGVDVGGSGTAFDRSRPGGSGDAAFCPDIADDTGGVADDDGVRRNIAGDDGGGPDHGSFTDGDAG